MRPLYLRIASLRFTVTPSTRDPRYRWTGTSCTPATSLYTINLKLVSTPAVYVDGTTRYRPGCSVSRSMSTPDTASEYGPEVATCRPRDALEFEGTLKRVRFNEAEGKGAANCRRKLPGGRRGS